jgi:cysteine-rich repeat protein
MLRSIVVRTSMALVCAVAVSGSASAQVQDSGQQRCLNKSSGSARKVATSTVKNSADCLKRAASGTLPMGTTAEACLISDLGGRIAKARSKTSSQVTSNCGGANVPDFGFTSADTLNDSHEFEAVSFVPDCFGPDLDAALAGPLATDAKAKCTSGALGATGKVADALLKTYLSCLKSGLKNGFIVDFPTMQNCLGDLVTDPRGRIGKAIGKVQSKLASSACPATPGDYFPALDGPDELCDRYGLSLPLNSSTLATCLGNRMRCRVCRTLNESNGLDQNCDLLDDGVVDGTCPQCPNGETDAGEECDDGNFDDGDGCTGQCVLEFCGDGVNNNNGTEECDDGEANSDTEPNACREDCTLPVCGDGVTDNEFDEDCDAAGLPNADCDPDCTVSECGDGDINLLDGEICDDGNFETNDACIGCQPATCGDGFVRTGVEQCDGSECCNILCLYALPGTACEGTEDVCTSPQCNGSGTCLESPANEGSPCDDGSECTASSSCQAGNCAADELGGVGLLCEWVMVGAPTNNTVVETNDGATIASGNLCGLHGEFDVSSVIAGTIVTSDDDNNPAGRGILFADEVEVGGDILTDGFTVQSDPLTPVDLPGLIGVTQIAAGQHVNKNPPGTYYDTTGTDSRIDDCEAAQANMDDVKNDLDALVGTPGGNLGATYQDLPTGPAPTINAINVGGVNVFDLTHLNGTAANVTLTLSGGGNANTVFVLRISQRLNTGANWIWNLTNGLTPDHLLIYVSKTSGDENCAIGQFNTGAGTIFCPELKLNVNGGTVWTGAAYGGALGTNGQVRIGDGSTLSYDPFIGDLP